jgi:LmbE family N-acetylglucosaminyl deacetylase
VQQNPRCESCEEKIAVARVRTAEALRACSFLGAQVVFTDQPDGDTAASVKECDRFTELIGSLKPDLVLTHWPIDMHHDHRSASVLAYQAWQ